MNIKPVHDNFKMPVKASNGAAAYDLYMPEGGTLFGSNPIGVFAGLGFKAAVPQGHVALLLPRSGKGAKNGLSLNNTVGVIDPDYRGEWMVCLRNRNERRFDWEADDRIVQMIVVKTEELDLVMVDDLDATNRGFGGFGSTGE